MITYIVIIAVVVISVLTVIANTSPSAWHAVKKQIKTEWEQFKVEL